MSRRIALIVPLLLASCARERAAAPVNRSTLRLLPHDTTGVLVLDIDGLKKSALYQKHAAGLPLFEQMKKDAGFDPRQDLRELVVATDGKRPLAIAQGKFKLEEIAKVFASNGSNASQFKGWTLFTKQDRTAAFQGGGRAIAGPDEMVRAAIGRDAEGAAVPAHLEALIREVPGTAQAWGVHWGAIDTGLAGRGNLGNLDKLFASVESLAGWADLRDGVRLELVGHSADDAAAKKLQAQIKGLIGLGRLSTPDSQPELLRVYDGIEVRQDGKTVRAQAAVSNELVERLVKLAPSLSRGVRP